MKKREPKQWRLIARVIMAVGFIPLVIAMTGDFWHDPLAYLGMAVVFASIIIDDAKWRCPHCDKALPNRIGWSVEFCPFCGGSLKKKI